MGVADLSVRCRLHLQKEYITEIRWPEMYGEHYHPGQIADTIIFECQIKHIFQSEIVKQY